jgi:hypothetical protein
MYLSAKTMAELIESIRAKAFEDVANLIRSDTVTKGDYDYLQIHADDLIELINSLDSANTEQEEPAKEELSESR